MYIVSQNQNAVWVQTFYVSMQLGYAEHCSSIITAEDVLFLTLRLTTTILLTLNLLFTIISSGQTDSLRVKN